ncbi:uncharacterized protein LOC125681429 [Ostrea edulis]|uniref:uncharacterized protein LOC125681429 n=1 Tax=Ostrea edulis TaxID=37623 RepID=UPI0024AE9CD3|nr:uncharacterized protein LOC125681429 [Ostrea edulis]
MQPQTTIDPPTMKNCSILLIMVLTISSSVKGCAFPAQLSGTWTDKHTGKDVIINSLHVNGWTVHLYNYRASDWKCAFEDSEQNHLLLRLKEDLEIFGMKIAVFRCIQWKKLDNCSYEITFVNKKELGARNDRVLAVFKQYVLQKNLTRYCSPSSDAKVHKITKQGCKGA